MKPQDRVWSCSGQQIAISRHVDYMVAVRGIDVAEYLPRAAVDLHEPAVCRLVHFAAASRSKGRHHGRLRSDRQLLAAVAPALKNSDPQIRESLERCKLFLAACEYTFTHQTSSVVAEYIDVTTRVSGDQFPAFETFLSDTRGGKVFLGGFAPESRSPAQLARLFGELNQPRDIFFESSVRISIRDGQRFRDVSGSWRSSSQTAKGTTLGTMSADAWNKMLMEQFPMPIDGWLYGKRVGEEGTSIRWRSASSPGGQ